MFAINAATKFWTQSIVLAAFFAAAITSAASAGSWMGVQVSQVPEELAAAHGLPPGIGVHVVDVQPDSPAANAGMEPGDVLVEIDGVVQLGPRHLEHLVANTVASQVVWVGLFRGEEVMSGPVTLGEAPAPSQQASLMDGPRVDTAWY